MLGYAEALLRHLNDVAKGNSPSQKVTAQGYLKSLIETSPKPSVINEGTQQGNGHITGMRIKYRQRGVEGQSSTSDNCDIDLRPVYSETTVNLTNFRKIAILIDDATMAQYTADATNMVAVGSPATSMMQDHVNAVIEKLNGFFADINADLLAIQLAKFGRNATTGSNATKEINFAKDVNIQSLTSGVTQLLSDFQDNEISGTPILVGAGLFRNYDMLMKVRTGPDVAGLDQTKFEPMYKFYYDRKANTVFGNNQLLAYSPGSILLLERNRYQGAAFTGQKGNSFFFTVTFPVVDQTGSSVLSTFKLDGQLKYYDCPTEVTVAGYDTPQTVNRGWVLILSKTYGQFNIPNDAYESTDVLTQNNGTLRYTISNDCETCD